MTVRRLATLQWLGLLFGAGAWAFAFVFGYGLEEAECSPGGMHWSIGGRMWLPALIGSSGLCVVAAGTAAVVVALRTRGVSYDGSAAPLARIRFFAIAAIAANTCFLMIVVLSALAISADVACRQA